MQLAERTSRFRRSDGATTRRGKQDNTDAGRQFVTSLARGLSILNAFTSGDMQLGNQELAARVKLTKPTVSRLTYTLTRLGFLQHCPDIGKYQLGTAALALGYRSMSNMYIRQIAKPFLDKAALDLNMCAALGYRDELSVVYLEYARGPSLLSYSLEPGSRIPLATTALGRSIIVTMSDVEREVLIRELRHSVSRESWPRVEAGIKQARADYKDLNLILALGDWEPEVHSVGMPLRFDNGHPSMALMLGGAARQFDRKKLIEEVGPYLSRLAQDIKHSVVSGAVPHI
jgi:DNA-binding IclR family transcriptional regulator